MKEIKTYPKDDSLTIEIPYSLIYENRTIKEFLKYLRIKRIVAKSQAKDEDIEKLSNEVKEKIWEESKDWFLQGIDK
jgi:hypothetical protein